MMKLIENKSWNTAEGREIKVGEKSGGKRVGRSHHFITPPVHSFLFRTHILSRNVSMKIQLLFH